MTEREDNQKLLVILDPDQLEMQCVDQFLHLGVSLLDNQKVKVHSMIQSKGDGSTEEQCVPGLPSNLFLVANLQNILKPRLQELQSLFS